MSAGYWTIPTRYGCQCVDFESGEIRRVLVVKLSENGVKNCFDGVDRGPGDLCVLHLSRGEDVRVSEAIDRFLAKRFDGGSRFFAAYYGELPQRQVESVLESADSAHELIGMVDAFHSVVPPSQARGAEFATQ